MNTDEKKIKPTYRSSIITDDALYEMVYDRHDKTTSFVKSDRYGNMEFGLQEVEIGGIINRPLPPTNQLVEKGVIHFPMLPSPYETEKEILDEIQAFIHKYLDISPVFEQIATYYVMFTWLYDRFNEVPYLRAIGDFGSGKSRFLQAVGILCYKPIFTGGATTPSPIFRIVSDVKGTLIIDEADFRYSDMTSEIVKILNTGYQKGMPVLRTEGKGVYEVKAYDVYGPKIVATRETFTDKALESRFLVEEMGSGKLRSDIPRSLESSFYIDAEYIRNKLLMWRFKNYFAPITRREEVIEGIHPRLNQIIIPLLSIIKEDATRERLKEFIIKYNSELVADRGLSWESDIVLAIFRLQNEHKKIELTVKEITEEANNSIVFGEDNLQSRKVGWYLRARLQLKTYRTRYGYTLNLDKNKEKLNYWKERYGITEVDIRGEHVNDVNDAEELRPQDIPF